MGRLAWSVGIIAAGLVVVLGAWWLTPAPQPSTTSQPTSQPKQPAVRAISEPLDLVPAESLLCWYGRQFPDVTPLAGEQSPLTTIIQLFPRVALDAEGRLYARMIEAFGVAIAYKHAIVLIDAAAKPVESDPNARRMDKLRLAMIVQSGDKDAPLMRVIQSAINEQTDSAQASLKLLKSGDWPYQELRDKRLPDWCIVAWGKIGDEFVMTVGEDVWPEIAAVARGEQPALSRAKWLSDVRGERGERATIEIIVSAALIRERLDPFVHNRASDFFAAWHAEDLERAHWALGFEGRALYCVANFQEHGKVRERVFADRNVSNPRLLETIPDSARYAIYRAPARTIFPRLCQGWLATQGREYRNNVMKIWGQMQTEFGFDAETDILAHLGDFTVMHNYPPHPLHIPLAMTTLTVIRDEPEHVAASIEKMCRAWEATWNRAAEEAGEPLSVQLVRDNSGIWHFRLPFGLAGPAWTVTDRFVITSWSPTALRTYLNEIGDRVGKQIRPTASEQGK